VTETNTVYYHHDGLGSTVALTEGTGNVVESYTYDVYGQPSFLSATYQLLPTSSVTNRFLFTGREYLAELALYDYRHRFYSPSLGRFLQTDPIRFDAEDVNLYRFIENSPVDFVDPDGLSMTAPGAEVWHPMARKGTPEQAKFWGDVVAPSVVLAAYTFAAAPWLLETVPLWWDKLQEILKKCPEDLKAAKTAETLPGKLYHYTRAENVENILQKGLGYDRPLTWTTPAGNLSPVQAQIELALPANRGYPRALFEINTARLQQLGINPAVGPQRIMSTPTAGGGGVEIIFNQPIPPSAIRQVPFP